jgi:alkylation response protein AidB-like acyl-CoA dehydrogenase
MGVDVALSTMDPAGSDVRELREALRRALGKGRGAVPRVDAHWRDGWPSIADLGVTALCVAEAKGGFGFRVDAAAGAAMEFGAALHGAPFAGLTAGMHALAQAADAPPVDGLLSSLLSGERICAFGQWHPSEGVARLVDGAVGADALMLADDSGALILLQEQDDWDTDPSRHRFDVTRNCADVTVKAGAGQRIPTDGSPARLYRLLLSADAVGGIQQMLDRTVDYSLQRQAFGRPIGGFQAVQHRLAEHAVRTRGMALLVEEAARLLAAGSPDAGRVVAMAEVSVSSGAGHILHDLLQLTGAIGFTWEYGLHYYERRAHTSARLAANPRAAVRSLAALEGWIDAG